MTDRDAVTLMASLIQGALVDLARLDHCNDRELVSLYLLRWQDYRCITWGDTSKFNLVKNNVQSMMLTRFIHNTEK